MTRHTFRTLRDRVLKEVLEAAGFERGKKMFVRPHGDQIHGIELQLGDRKGMYTYNAGFTYAFLPGFFEFKHVPPPEMIILDFLWSYRPFDAAGIEQWWSYDGSPDRCESELRDACSRLVWILDQYAVEWKNSADFLNKLPPSMMNDYIEFVYSDGKKPRVVLEALGYWMCDILNTCYFLAAQALRSNLPALAVAYADLVLPLEEYKMYNKPLQRLRQEAERLQKQ